MSDEPKVRGDIATRFQPGHEAYRNAPGNPSTYTEELGEEICAKIATGRSLQSVCNDKGMPHRITVFKWLRKDPAFAALYTIAKAEAADALADQMLDIADDGTNDYVESSAEDGGKAYRLNGEAINRSRLRVETRKWICSRMQPRKYGDRMTHAGDEEAPVTIKGVVELVRPT